MKTGSIVITLRVDFVDELLVDGDSIRDAVFAIINGRTTQHI
jgi:hypothetical protein